LVPKISNQERTVMEKVLEELREVEASELEIKGKDFSFSDVQELNVLGTMLYLIENPDVFFHKS